MLKSIALIAYWAVLTVIWLGSWAGFWLGSPVLAILGSLLASGAPLLFFIQHGGLRMHRAQAHPVWVSVVSGLGAVLVMVAIYRFGDQHTVWMVSPLISLAGWMAYLKAFPSAAHVADD